MVKIMKISSSPIETLNLLSMSPSWFWKKRVKSMLNMRRFCFLKGRASPSASRTGASRGGRKLVGGSKPSEYSFSSQTQAGGNHRSHARRSRRPGKWSQERWWQSQEGCYRGKIFVPHSVLHIYKKNSARYDSPVGYSGFQVVGFDRMGTKIKSQKHP